MLALALLLASASAQAAATSAPLAAGVAPLVSDEIVAGERSEPELEATLSVAIETQHINYIVHSSNVGLWIVQSLLALTFVGTGLWKLGTPISELAVKMPWMGEVSQGFLYATAVFDILGGLGVLVPSVTRIKPGLTVLAAFGCAALMTGAIVFHVSRGEAANTPFNFVLVALALFVAWGRYSKAPIAPRS